MRYLLDALRRRFFPGWPLLLCCSCGASQDLPGCDPAHPQTYAATYLAEAAPIIERGECDGLTSETCPALDPARKRMKESLDEWKKGCGR